MSRLEEVCGKLGDSVKLAKLIEEEATGADVRVFGIGLKVLDEPQVVVDDSVVGTMEYLVEELKDSLDAIRRFVVKF